MRLCRYINEGRSVNIPIKEAIGFLRENCKDFLKNGSILYRGIYDADQPALIVSPSNFERKSRNTANYYTLLMDNLPAWKDYPKRSKSIVCTTHEGYAGNMGEPYRVFPFNGSKIGVCPSNDLWGSFTLDVYSLEYVNDSIDFIIRELDFKHDINSYKDLLKLFDEFDAYKSNIGALSLDKTLFGSYINNDTKFIDFISEMLNPKKQSFQLRTTRSFKNLPYREVWTDGTSILVHTSIVNNIIKEFNNS